MFVNTAPTPEGDRALIGLGEGNPLELVTSRRRISSGNSVEGGRLVVASDMDAEVLQARFNDIVEALAADTVDIYDCTQPVGYWKPKKAARKSAPKEEEAS